MTQIPDKLFFKIGEVAHITQVESHILRYWETEFQTLHPRKNDSGQRLYIRRDIEHIFKIKRLLHEEGYTIQGARKKLGRKPKTDQDKTIQTVKEDLKRVLSILSP